MERAEIASLIFSTLFLERPQDAIAPYVAPASVWVLTSADQVSLRGTPPRGLTFTGAKGCLELSQYFRKTLRVTAGEMTGCISRRNVTFVFGKIQLESQVSHESAETSFAARLTFRESEILEAQIQLSWVIPV